ncbi:MAG: hypothetical protein WBV73_10965 [Phormidium sp.]
MTKFIYDQFAKDYLKELLTPLGEVETSRDVPEFASNHPSESKYRSRGTGVSYGIITYASPIKYK